LVYSFVFIIHAFPKIKNENLSTKMLKTFRFTQKRKKNFPLSFFSMIWFSFLRKFMLLLLNLFRRKIITKSSELTRRKKEVKKENILSMYFFLLFLFLLDLNNLIVIWEDILLVLYEKPYFFSTFQAHCIERTLVQIWKKYYILDESRHFNHK
jgi:hypothetical protein